MPYSPFLVSLWLYRMDALSHVSCQGDSFLVFSRWLEASVDPNSETRASGQRVGFLFSVK